MSGKFNSGTFSKESERIGKNRKELERIGKKLPSSLAYEKSEFVNATWAGCRAEPVCNTPSGPAHFLSLSLLLSFSPSLPPSILPPSLHTQTHTVHTVHTVHTGFWKSLLAFRFYPFALWVAFIRGSGFLLAFVADFIIIPFSDGCP